MRYKLLLLLMTTAVLLSCQKEKAVMNPPPPPPPTPAQIVFLKDMVAEGLPSPYYHFEYDQTGKANLASFASGFSRYNIIYTGGRISEMKSNSITNMDRLQYSYDNGGRVTMVTYATEAGEVYAKVHLTYDGQKLIKLERERKGGSVFILNKTLAMSYYADGNLKELIYHFPVTPINPVASTFTDRFEEYDTKINVDGFGLLHGEFFDNLVFLPGVQLQKNNPRKEIRSGDGDDYTVNYTYTYNNHHAPLSKAGELIFTSGPSTGQEFQTNLTFTYY